MNLKQIVKKGLIAGGLAFAFNGFANGNIPKVNADELSSYQFGAQRAHRGEKL
ncbi:hypothetical protein ES703_44690 [subsurface metagenome]